LHEPNTRPVASYRFVHDRLHQPATDTVILDIWIDRNWPDAGDWRTEINEVATGETAILFGNEAIKVGMLGQH
jgi:hypothetical protein